LFGYGAKIVMQSFYQWLQQYRTDDSAIGDLARAARLGRNRPRINTLAAWENHIAAMGGSYTVGELLREAWQLYESGTTPPPSDRTYRLRRGDERWTIERPPLPNWMATLPALVYVRSTRARENEPIDVKVVSGEVFCEAVEQFARYFRREFSYDFLAYTAREHQKRGDGAIHPYLFFDPRDVNDVIMRPIGACGFWYAEEASCWVLGWIWLHPFARRSGHLLRAWPFFRQRYNSFTIQQPWSDAMAAFLRKVDYPATE